MASLLTDSCLRFACVDSLPEALALLGLDWDNGKENGNYYNGLYRDHGVHIWAILG